MDFKLQLLEAITNNFSEGYEDVYRGVLDGKDIAVKKLHKLQKIDDKQFHSRYRDLVGVSHKNVLGLIGYGHESRSKYMNSEGELDFVSISDRVLCFEYVQGKSLDRHIADESCELDWPICYKIIKGTCEGLNHLHTKQEKPIFHLDLKPSNILLDESMTPKISGLGLSALVSLTETHKTEILRGAEWYMPPEYRDSGLVSNKFDVFSLGIIIIKTVAGNMGYFRYSEMSPKDFIEFVSVNWMKRWQAMPGYYSSHEVDILTVITCIETALRCVETNHEKRPCIEDIVHELDELEAEIKRIRLLAPNPMQILLSNQGPGMEFPKISRLCMAHNLAQYKRILDFKFSLIEAITNGFSDDQKIGSDGYGDVYRALYNGEEIVVKKLHSLEGLDDKQFENEMHILTEIHHKNVGRLIGYCYETCLTNVEHNAERVSSVKTERVLCFEYTQSGSLDKHIADEPCGLDWSTLYKIIKGTCEGLNHLLSAQQKPILHLDLTPANIFLVNGKTPKIIGFGLWRLIDLTKMHQTKIFKETHGYMPPEYVDTGFISNKFDVFSLGAIIIKLMAGNMGYSRCFEMSPKEFIQHVSDNWTKRLHAMPGYSPYEIDILRVSACVEIALRCVDDDREKRPCIEDIVHKLGELEARVKTIMLLPHDHRRGLLTNLGPVPYFPKHIRLYMSHNLAQNGSVTGYKSNRLKLDSQSGPTSTTHGRKSEDPSLQTGCIPHHMSLQYLKDITNNFSDDRIIGRGGFSVVYKGIQPSGEMVAVKKFVQPTSSQEEFENELKLLMELKHPNIVQLVGYCYETRKLHMFHEGEYIFAEDTQTLLCLECLPNGSLENYISDASSRLHWHTRYKIIEGISSGLQYLHEQFKDPILHLDLKPANILLDKNMLPKITDFGLSRLFDQSQSIHTARTCGTLGYMPREFLQGIITPMSDIFSLGVIILEVITGHKGYPDDIRTSSKTFIEPELKKWRNVLQNKPGYRSIEKDCQQIKRCIQIGLICVNHDRTKRPTMKKIIDMLQGLESMNWYISNEHL
ncbi:receptor like protein kinase S.2-like isoform X1 [Triticum dicoccoides]|uniref:receptor like protein kinase S.2-like isoform X1 n=1 Tax=Triticum dicoccoides TaxID=85692 RepID=UPI001890D40A|nr:receptor like protein kinase S.2-like isoform X1 [Triticum dicoccoides]XP_037463249.1 receptor like protein kinase S.2-like isoform X1 [Triticum dicoccoides]